MSDSGPSGYERRTAVDDTTILEIASLTAPKWKKIAERLKNAGTPGKLAFPLDSSLLSIVTKDCVDDEDKVKNVLVSWRAMHPSHTCGLLYDTLVQCGYGAIAQQELVTPQREKAGEWRILD